MARPKKNAEKKVEKKEDPNKEYFIVAWNNEDGDAIKVFDSYDKACKFISECLLMNKDDDYDYSEVDKDSIKLFRGVLLGNAKVDVSFEPVEGFKAE